MENYTFCHNIDLPATVKPMPGKHSQVVLGKRHMFSQQGGALITLILTLLSLAILVLTVTGQQVLAHAQQISLDEQRLYRQLATEQLFDEVAERLELNSNGLQHKRHGSHFFAQGGAGQRVLYSAVNKVPCPHDDATSSLCWRVQISQAGSGFMRERMLIIPEQSCASAYWYPPQGRVVDGPVLPPVNEPPDDNEPQPLPPRPRPRILGKPLSLY